ncbi:MULTISPECIES: hypothetical protein [Cupriavidus]
MRHLAVHHHGAQVALVLGQRGVQQQLALVLGQVQHVAEHVDIAHQQHALAVQPCGQRRGRDVEHGEHVLGVVLDVFVEVIEQRALVEGAVPLAVPLEEFLRGQARGALPGRHVGAARGQEALHAQHHAVGPHHVLGADGQDVVDVAAQVEARPQRAHHAQGELGAHPVERGGARRDSGGTQQRGAVIIGATGEVHSLILSHGGAGAVGGAANCSSFSYASALCGRSGIAGNPVPCAGAHSGAASGRGAGARREIAAKSAYKDDLCSAAMRPGTGCRADCRAGAQQAGGNARLHCTKC